MQTDIEQQVEAYCDWLVAHTEAEMRPVSRDLDVTPPARSRVGSYVAMIAAAAVLVVATGVALANREGVGAPETPPTLGTLPQESSTLPSAQTTSPTLNTLPQESSTLPSAQTTEPSESSTTTEQTTAPLGASWLDADSYPSNYQPGCCAGNATGLPSPELAVAPAPLADGTYAMEIVDWTADDPTRVQVSVRSLVTCADGVTGCSPLGDGTFGPDDVGFSDEARSMEVVLDDSVIVYLAGDEIGAAASTSPRGSNLRSANGTRLAELMVALANAYETEIGEPLRVGTAPDVIAADLQSNPRSGFTSAADLFTGQLYFSFGDAPPVLFQSIAQQGEPLPRSGTSALLPRTITIEQGNIVLELYAGFRS